MQRVIRRILSPWFCQLNLTEESKFLAEYLRSSSSVRLQHQREYDAKPVNRKRKREYNSLATTKYSTCEREARGLLGGHAHACEWPERGLPVNAHAHAHTGPRPKASPNHKPPTSGLDR
jgi:hypothetical protein